MAAGDSVSDLLREIPQVVAQLQINPTDAGFDRAEHIKFIGTEYSRTLGILVRRTQFVIGCIEEGYIRNDYPSLDVAYDFFEALRSLYIHLNAQLEQFSSGLTQSADNQVEFLE